MKKIIKLLVTISILGSTSHADCLSKYDSAFYDKRKLFQFTHHQQQGEARIGDYVVGIPAAGVAVGLVSCLIGCPLTMSFAPLLIFSGAGIAAGTAVALAIPVKILADGSVSLNRVRKTIRQAEAFVATNQKLHYPLKKVVERVQSQRPDLSAQQIAVAIVEANRNETFCKGSKTNLTTFSNLDDLIVAE